MAIARQVDHWVRRAGRLILPPTCVLCGAAGNEGRDLCRACAVELARNTPCCARCALPLEFAAALCGACLKRAPAFDAALIPYRYDYPLDRLLTRFKFGADLGVGRVLADLLGDALSGAATQVDLLIPVPLHGRRLASRGFNQALELARLLAPRIDSKVAPRKLTRVRATTAQTGLVAQQRRQNVRGAFACSGTLKGKRVALVDDVVTTSATARECARVLKRAGAAHVELWAVARAAGPKG